VFAYVGQTSSRKLVAHLTELGIGEAVQPDEFPPRRTPWFLDNGAFKLWKNKLPFDGDSFLSAVERAASHAYRPDFIVVPDLVAESRSLECSLGWIPRLQGAGSLALVVQDGMTEEEVAKALPSSVRVLFVGGTAQWKLNTTARWTALAHRMGLRCHVGRVGSKRRAQWAREVGVDSIDSCTPLFSADNLRRWLSGLREPYQAGLFGAITPKHVVTNLFDKEEVKP
jgi:hypothetical protein